MSDNDSKTGEEMSLKERIEKNRKLIFFMELAGLLHDTGKLDSRFIDFRQKWQKGKDGWNMFNDPHDDKEKPFFDHDPLLIEGNGLKALRDCLNLKAEDICGKKEIWVKGHPLSIDISLKELIHQHTRVKHEFVTFLKLGDSIDSAYDRNRPLFVMEQMKEDVFASTVFGHESPLQVDSFDRSRELLYHQLNSLLPDYLSCFSGDKRSKIFSEAEKAFRIGVTDTRRPANDITLWQHVYMTTALSKVFLLHFLIYGERFNKFKDCRFSLAGFGWDGLGFISRGHKIGDIVSKKRIIFELKKQSKELLEFNCPIGMNVYDDDNGIYFIVPAALNNTEGVDEYKELLKEISSKVLEIGNDVTGGELLPVSLELEKIKDTKFIMDIVHTIDGIRKKSKYPYPNNNIKPCWINTWGTGASNEVCSVCQYRPLVDKQSVCSICMERRKFAQKLRDERQSVFTDEIADKNGRLALIVARFNLESWLSGDMLWSLFVKERHSMEKALCYLTKIKDLENVDKERLKVIEKKIKKQVKDFSFKDYEEIKNYIKDCQKKGSKFGKAIAFLFDKHGQNIPEKVTDWKEHKEWIDDVNKNMNIGKRFNDKPDLYHYLLTKNHTPSRLLNVWNTTREFLSNIFNIREIKECLPSFRRLEIVFDKALDLLPNAVYEATIAGERVEIMMEDESIFVINSTGKESDLSTKEKTWRGKEITISPSEFERKKSTPELRAKIKNISYASQYIYPYRTITTSPDLIMALVPADKAVDISRLIYEQYINQFGKVIGRLPFSLGNIFFPKKTTMFVVLDAGRRMAENFAERYKNYLDNTKEAKERMETLKVESVENKDSDSKKDTTAIHFKNRIKWNLNQYLGNGEMDTFHPYLIVKDCKGKKGFCYDTFLGKLVHFSEMEKNFEIQVYPNYYDFEFLDSTTRRYDIAFDSNNKRKSNISSFFSKPYFLDELEYGFEKVWGLLKKTTGMTDTKLRNIESLWLSKLEGWGDGKQWKDLVTSTLKKELPRFKDCKTDKDRKDFEFLKEAVFSGLFFDCLELNLRILKRRISDKSEKED